MRITKQRTLILDIINNSHEHLSAEEIYEASLKVINNISLGTVYRNLNRLVADNLIRKIKANGKNRYDQKNVKHNHFFCNRCHKIIDIFTDYQIPFKDNEIGIINEYEINLKGICMKCLEKEKEKENGIKRK